MDTGVAVDHHLADLERKIAHVAEPAMRTTLVLEMLRALAPEEVYALLARVLGRPPASGGGTEFDRLRDVVHGAVLEGVADGSLSYELRRDVYALAVEADDETVARVLRTMPPAQQGAARLDPELAEIPLGRRRSLARGGDPLLLEKLARDPDPVVIRHILANPRTRERDVVRMAALRPVAGATLTEIARSSRWSGRLHVRTALARNPCAPVELALRLATGLPTPTLREMRRDPDLHPELVRHVEAEIERRARH